MAIRTMGPTATRIAICTKASVTMISIVSNIMRIDINSRNRLTSIFDCIKIWTMIDTTITRAIDRTTLTLNTLRGLDRVFPLTGFHFVSGDKALG